MPDNDSPDTQGADEPATADFSNRAARRRRGKDKDASSSQAHGKVQDPGRRNTVQGPRHWSVRRSG
jgi:hypothetical protein